MRPESSMLPPTRLVTATDLEQLPGHDNRYELVQGRLVPLSPVGFGHAQVVVRVIVLLEQCAGRDAGAVLTEAGFILARNPDTVRAPDVAFVRRERIPSPDPRGFLDGPPDLAVEVLSPGDRLADVRVKVAEYVAFGVSVILLMDPDARTVSVFRGRATGVTLVSLDDELDLGDVVPGFHCTLRDIFES
jgi:Uma2 family endonuclease